jgi:hypothetical protein
MPEPHAEQGASRRDVIRDEHAVGDDVWTIEFHDDQPIEVGKKYAADNRVVLLLNGERVREFMYPAYRIWTLLAHWTEGLAELTGADDDD